MLSARGSSPCRGGGQTGSERPSPATPRSGPGARPGSPPPMGGRVRGPPAVLTQQLYQSAARAPGASAHTCAQCRRHGAARTPPVCRPHTCTPSRLPSRRQRLIRVLLPRVQTLPVGQPRAAFGVCFLQEVGFAGGSASEESACNAGDLGSRKIPWRRQRLPTPVFWPGEFHGLCSPRGRRVPHD